LNLDFLCIYGVKIYLYKLHFFVYTDANYTCAHCRRQFVEKYNFDLHLKYSPACRDVNSEVLKCGKCGEVFTTLINLQQHIRRHEQNNRLTPTYRYLLMSTLPQSLWGLLIHETPYKKPCKSDIQHCQRYTPPAKDTYERSIS